MELLKIKTVKMKADCTSLHDKKKGITIYALKGELLKVNTQRGDMLIVKGKKDIFPINIDRVEVVEYE